MLTQSKFFLHRETGLVDKATVVNVIHLDLSQASDTMAHYMLICKVEKCGLNNRGGPDSLKTHAEEVVSSGALLKSEFTFALRGGLIVDLVPANIFVTDLNDGIESERVKCEEGTRLRGYRSSLEDRIRRTNEHDMLGKKLSA